MRIQIIAFKGLARAAPPREPLPLGPVPGCSVAATPSGRRYRPRPLPAGRRCGYPQFGGSHGPADPAMFHVKQRAWRAESRQVRPERGDEELCWQLPDDAEQPPEMVRVEFRRRVIEQQRAAPRTPGLLKRELRERERRRNQL